LVCGACGDDAHGWDQGIVTALFGYEPQSGEQYVTRNQGALMFWDVFPKCDRLAVDIMTPHYGDYYQGNATPHDSGQPNPILFLTVPPGSSFTFHVQCNLALLPKALRDSWQILLEAAFRHTFDWLGFGAKTAVG
jgi:CRISPR-associated protein Cmr6